VRGVTPKPMQTHAEYHKTIVKAMAMSANARSVASQYLKKNMTSSRDGVQNVVEKHQNATALTQVALVVVGKSEDYETCRGEPERFAIL